MHIFLFLSFPLQSLNPLAILLFRNIMESLMHQHQPAIKMANSIYVILIALIFWLPSSFLSLRYRPIYYQQHFFELLIFIKSSIYFGQQQHQHSFYLRIDFLPEQRVRYQSLNFDSLLLFFVPPILRALEYFSLAIRQESIQAAIYLLSSSSIRLIATPEIFSLGGNLSIVSALTSFNLYNFDNLRQYYRNHPSNHAHYYIEINQTFFALFLFKLTAKYQKGCPITIDSVIILRIYLKMGTNTSKPPLPSQLIAHKDSRYGGNVMIDSQNTRAFQIMDIDQTNVDNFSNLLAHRKQLRHPNLISVNRTWVDQYRQDCSFMKMYRITIEYLFIPFTLEDQINRFCCQRMPMPEPLIRKYFYQIVSCLQYLKQKRTCHGDVKPKNILIDKQGKAYLADSFFINGGKISFQIVIEDPQSLSLLSPFQLQSLKNKKFSTLKQVHEDQIFGIGLSMIQAMTAQPAMQCYDLANLTLKPTYFQNKYRQLLSNSYSPQLCQLVMKCVQINPENRVKFVQFLKQIGYNAVQQPPLK